MTEDFIQIMSEPIVCSKCGKPIQCRDEHMIYGCHNESCENYLSVEKEIELRKVQDPFGVIKHNE